MYAQLHLVGRDFYRSVFIRCAQPFGAFINIRACYRNSCCTIVLHRCSCQVQGCRLASGQLLYFRRQACVTHSFIARAVVVDNRITIIYQSLRRIFAYFTVDFADPACFLILIICRRSVRNQLSLSAGESDTVVLHCLNQRLKHRVTTVVVLHVLFLRQISRISDLSFRSTQQYGVCSRNRNSRCSALLLQFCKLRNRKGVLQVIAYRKAHSLCQIAQLRRCNGIVALFQQIISIFLCCLLLACRVFNQNADAIGCLKGYFPGAFCALNLYRVGLGIVDCSILATYSYNYRNFCKGSS